jgi:hypothetical protein
MVLVEPLVQVVLLVQAQVGHQVHQEVQVQEELVVHRVHQVAKVIKVVFNTNTVVVQVVLLLQVNLLIKERV